MTAHDPRRYTWAGGYFAEGGMGRLRVAWDAHLLRRVVVKEPRSDSPDARERFVREARVAAVLDHPNILPVHELGERADGSLYYTTREIRGETLERAMRSPPAGRLPLLPHFERVCEAIAYAHSRGIIHRDLKPSNIMVGPFGETVVIDWGIAHVVGAVEEPVDGGESDAGERLTRTGAFLGTHGYASPEQLRGEPADVSFDVWALAAILANFLEDAPRAPPVAPPSPATIAPSPPSSPAAARGPAELLSIVRKAHDPDPAARYPSVEALLGDVRAWREGRRVGAHRYRPLERTGRLIARNPRVVLSAAAVVLLVGGAGAYAEVARTRAEAEAQERAAAEAGGEGVQALLALGEGHLQDAARHAVRSLAVREDPSVRGALLQARRAWTPTLAAPVDLPGCLAFAVSPSGSKVACVTSGTLDVWRLGGDAAERLGTVPLATPRCGPPAWRADPEVVAVGTLGGDLVTWGPEGGKTAVGLLRDPGTSCSMVWSGGHDPLVVGLERGGVYRVEDGRMQVLGVATASATLLAGRPDGQTVAVNGIRDIQSLFLPGGLREWIRPETDYTLLAYSPDGRSLYVSGTATSAADHIERLDGASGRQLLSQPVDGAGVRGLEVSPTDGRIAAVTTDDRVRLYAADTLDFIGELDGDGRPVRQAAFSPDGGVLYAITGVGQLLRWALPKAIPPAVMDAGRRFVFDVAVSPSGEWAATGSQDGSVRVFDWRTGRVIQRWTHSGHDPEAIGWLDDRRLVLSTESGHWEVYEVGAAERVGLIVGHGDAYAFSARGDWLFATGNAHDTCAWSIADPSAPAWCDPLEGSGNTVVPLPGGRLFEASYGAELRVLEGSTGAVLARSVVPGIAFGRGAVSPDGGDVVLTVRADDGSTSLARMHLPRGDDSSAPPAEVVWSTPGDRALSVDWSPDGSTLAAATINGAVALYDASTGQLLAQTHAHHPSAWRAVFVDDGRALLSVGGEGTLRTWDLSDARPPSVPAR